MVKVKNNEYATKADLKKLESGLNNKLGKIQHDISGLKQDVSGLKQDVSGLKQDVSGLKKGQASLKKDVLKLQEDVLDLKLDAKEAREERREILKELKIIQQSIVNFDSRVRYQQDLPERVEQLEQDVHELKRQKFKSTHARP